MRKYFWIAVIALIVSTVYFTSCERGQKMLEQVMPDAEPEVTEPTPEPEMVETPVEATPVEPMVEPEPIEMPSQANVTEGLVLHLSFDEDTIQGNIVKDQSTEGNDGIINGAAQTVPGKSGEAMEFDGTDDFVEVPLTGSITFSTGDSFTVQAWIKTDDAPQLDDGIVGNYRQLTDKFWGLNHLGDNPEWRGKMSINLNSHVSVAGENEEVVIGENEEVVIGESGELLIRVFTAVGSENFLNDNEWHVLAAVRDQTAKKLRFYVDGELVGETDDVTDDINSGQSIWIGEHRDRFYKGLIDEVKIWSRPLTPEELE